ncbi:hypothetical protein [Sporisorium scitamineum]|uniref:Uncharacterized protein n=1 Tax=Sporisorium scitamineum TaxID=49012 RepID=A0A0F7SCM0_9BASI|nr:hypothetical protein [Sporisorium scitamineum]
MLSISTFRRRDAVALAGFALPKTTKTRRASLLIDRHPSPDTANDGLGWWQGLRGNTTSVIK